MAGLQNLKKKLRSIRATGQLAGAMKTVSAAKYSKIGALNEAYAGYAQAARALRERFGRDLASAMPCGNPDAPDGYLVLSSNRGLCGGYNNELLAEAMRRLRESPRPWLLMTGGKVAETFFQSKGLPIHRAFRVPDVPGYADVQALCTELLEAYRSGEISSVRLVYQHFQNVLTQLPRVETLLPFAAGEDVGTKSAEASHHGAAEGSPAALPAGSPDGCTRRRADLLSVRRVCRGSGGCGRSAGRNHDGYALCLRQRGGDLCKAGAGAEPPPPERGDGRRHRNILGF